MTKASTIRNLALLLAPSVIPWSLSCGPRSCAFACPSATFNSRLLSGSATFAADKGQATFRVGEGCNAEFRYTRSADGHIVNQPVRVLQCSSGGQDIAVDISSAVVEADKLASGKHTFPAGTAGLEVLGPFRLCAAIVAGGTVDLDVTQVEGQVAAYPQLVTNDFLRRYQVHLELSGNHTGCGGVSFVADLEVEQTAKDVVARPDNVCYCL